MSGIQPPQGPNPPHPGQGGYGSQPGPQGYPAPTTPGMPPPPQQASHRFGPLNQPGTIPLRPLDLGAIFAGTWQTIRKAPKATILLVLLVAGLAIPISVAISMVTGTLMPDSFTESLLETENPTTSETGIALSYFTGLAGSLSAQLLMSLLVALTTAPIIATAAAGVRGRYYDIGEAWQAGRGAILRVIGLSVMNTALIVTLVLAVLAIGMATWAVTEDPLITLPTASLAAIAAFALGLGVYIKYFYLAAPIAVVEGGFFSAIARAGRLSVGNWWRLFGYYLLMTLLLGAVSSAITTPFSLVGTMGGMLLGASFTWAGPFMATMNSIGIALTLAITHPFMQALVYLQYVDLRFRKEGYDIELINELSSGTPHPAVAVHQGAAAPTQPTSPWDLR